MAKNKKVIAWILSGVLLAGSFSPITSNAAEISTESQISDEADETTTEIQTADGEEDTGMETAAAEKSTEETKVTEEEGTEETTTEEDIVKDGMPEEGTDGGSRIEETIEETIGDEIENDGITGEENKALASDREIASSDNVLSGFNTSFEGVKDSGDLHWWNGPAWSPVGISQKAYGENEAPVSDCGSNYLEVIPASNNGKNESVAQICHEDAAKLIETEILYGFTYWAKLSNGQSSGEVQLQVASVASDWSSSANAEIKLDSEVTLNDSQWQQISGTFRLPVHSKHEQVKIAFAGSENLSFCIDDLRVMALESKEEEHGDNLVKNPNFAEADLSVWGGATITAGTQEEPIFDDVKTYGKIESRTQNSECFEQEMTDIIKSGSSYKYSFWVMLDAEDYKDAADNERQVSFAPYVHFSEGDPIYWGSYSAGVLDNNATKSIEAGKWVKFEGTFNPEFKEGATKIAIRIIEQGPNNGSSGGKQGKYYVTGVSLCEVVKPVKEIEKDIPNLKDSVSSADGIGTDAYTGTEVLQNEMKDSTLMELVYKHFNAVTLGNELKMDALFGYSNEKVPGLEKVTWTRADGTVMTDYEVPTLDYSRAEACLDMILEWNKEHSDSQIKVRGHVLVWHSQAPEWFFHEDWDASKPDVSAEVMDVRQEWYIKTVLEHFLGDASPYKDMFYGWDVVNEAVSDSRGTYRNDAENSSWWRVYKSEQYIINAFKYANKYAPADLELYYNDYNECYGNKVDGIVKLLEAVKSHESDSSLPTRITGMGMQSHHNMSSPTAKEIKAAAIRYGTVVGKIQLTELDIKTSDGIGGFTENDKESGFTKEGYRYKEIYDAMREVDAMDGIDVNGITVWGVIDGYSWLQTSNNAGGGADGTKKQFPLLFDDDYKAKPAFYAFVNPEKLEPLIQNIKVIQAVGDNPYANGETYQIPGIDASFIPVWTKDGLKIRVTVPNSNGADDGVAVYIVWDGSRTDGAAIEKQEVKKAAYTTEGNSFVAEFTISKDFSSVKGFCMDVVVTADGQSYAFNDRNMTQESSSKYYAAAVTKPYMVIGKAANGITIDGEKEEAWNNAEEVQLSISLGNAKATTAAKVLWDAQYLYVLADVADGALDKSSAAAHEQDSLEVFIDENNNKSDAYEADDKQYRVNYENEQSFNGPKCKWYNIKSAAVTTETGYRIEAAYKWTDVTPIPGNKIGIELQINDAAGGTRIGTVSWYDESGMGWSSPGVFGTATLGGQLELADLTKLITECGALAENKYTAESWKGFSTALGSAKTVAEGQNPAQDAIVNAYKALGDARIALRPEKTELNNLITECEALKADKDKYTAESWAEFIGALEKADEAAKDEYAPLEVVEDVCQKLSDAKAALESIGKDALGKLITECEALDKDKYTAESWEVFSAALSEAKEVADSQDATPEKVTEAYQKLSEAKAALQLKSPEGTTDKTELRKLISDCEGLKLNPNHYTTDSWNAYKTALENAKEKADSETATQEDIQAAVTNLSKALEQLKEREGLWAFEIGDMTYTGKALKPEVTVFNGTTELTKGKDYTVSYKNNTKISTDNDKAKVIIKGKGNYAKTITKEFKIVPKNLTDEDIAIADLYVMPPKAGKSITPAPVVTRDGKKLGKKEFSVSAIKDKDGKPVERVTEPGIYTVDVTGVEAKGYTGTRTISLTVLNSDQKLMSKAKVTGIKNKEYNDGKVVEPEFTVKYGSATLTLNEDYTVFCDSTEVGTATAVIRGNGTTYVGEKTVTFKITGTVLKAKDVELENAAGIEYTGSAIEPVVKIEGAVKDRDYEVTYDKNVKAGTAAVTVKGIGKYTGTVKKNFKIAAFDVSANREGKLSYSSSITVKYMKGGSKLKEADLNVTFGGERLTEGVDYTLVYTKNKQVGSEATVKIKGKGNFKGTTAAIPFTIEQQDIGQLTDISAADVLEKNAKKYDRVVPVVKDYDGKALKKGTDFDVSYTKEDGKTPIEETPVVGDRICITITGKGNYMGTAYAYFRIIENDKNISKATVTVKPQSYTGKAVTLSEQDINAGQIEVTIKVKGNKVTLTPGTDYVIMENGYAKNINKGTAQLTIQGINKYGGTKKASFKIVAYDFEDNVKWYESLSNKTKSWFNSIFNK